MDKFKLAIILAYFMLAVLGLVTVALIMVYRPDATATIINFVGTIMGVASTGAVTFWMLNSQGKKLEEVSQKTEQVAVQTNGVNSALRDRLLEKDNQIEQLQSQLLSAVHSAPTPPPEHRAGS